MIPREQDAFDFVLHNLPELQEGTTNFVATRPFLHPANCPPAEALPSMLQAVLDVLAHLRFTFLPVGPDGTQCPRWLLEPNTIPNIDTLANNLEVVQRYAVEGLRNYALALQTLTHYDKDAAARLHKALQVTVFPAQVTSNFSRLSPQIRDNHVWHIFEDFKTPHLSDLFYYVEAKYPDKMDESERVERANNVMDRIFNYSQLILDHSRTMVAVRTAMSTLATELLTLKKLHRDLECLGRPLSPDGFQAAREFSLLTASAIRLMSINLQDCHEGNLLMIILHDKRVKAAG